MSFYVLGNSWESDLHGSSGWILSTKRGELFGSLSRKHVELKGNQSRILRDFMYNIEYDSYDLML